VVVEEVDIVSGVGRARAEAAGSAATRFHDVHRLVTDLGVFDFGGPEHTLRFVSIHPGESVESVREASGCDIHADGDVPETREPTAGELVLIRELLDPSNLREREVPAR
jgi:acyl CoA:acetate/3-ketoacid CoA transferase beta subunit